jgi:hypothetical protein
MLPSVLCGCETWSLTLSNNGELTYLRTGCSARYLGTRGEVT